MDIIRSYLRCVFRYSSVKWVRGGFSKKIIVITSKDSLGERAVFELVESVSVGYVLLTFMAGSKARLLMHIITNYRTDPIYFVICFNRSAFPT